MSERASKPKGDYSNDYSKWNTIKGLQGTFPDSNEMAARTELMQAAESGHLARLKMLIAKDVKIDGRDAGNNTALHYACDTNKLECVHALLLAGADENAVSDLQDTPLHWACANGALECVRKMLEGGADKFKRNKYKKSPRDLAEKAEQCSAEMVELLDATTEAKDLRRAAFRRKHNMPEDKPKESKKAPEAPLVGKRVKLDGLVSKPELNGTEGVALRFDKAKGRYQVQLDATGESMLFKPAALSAVSAKPRPAKKDKVAAAVADIDGDGSSDDEETEEQVEEALRHGLPTSDAGRPKTFGDDMATLKNVLSQDNVELPDIMDAAKRLLAAQPDDPAAGHLKAAMAMATDASASGQVV